jgi:cobalt/nickel transport system permease protein
VLWLEPFAISVAALALFQPGGLHLFAAMLTKSTLCIACMLLLAIVAPFHQLVDTLRRWRVPGLLVTTLALAHRYLFVLAEESHRMRRARASRTFTRGRARWWTLLAGIIAQLFLRATERAERIYAAMCARGWKP